MAKATRPSSAAARPSAVRASAGSSTPAPPVKRPAAEFVFGKATAVWMGIGIALMLLGMALMAGGQMPSPDVWEPELIYSFRRITLAPIVILTGLGVITYAIFKK